MQAIPASVETSTVFITPVNSLIEFRVWYNPNGYWQIDIIRHENDNDFGAWLYFGNAPTLVRAFEQVAITL